MARKVYVNLKVRLVVVANDDTNVNQVLQDMEYDFRDQSGEADIVDTEIVDWEITDAK